MPLFTQRSSQFKDSCLIFLLGLCVFLIGLTNQAFYSFQTRLAVFAQEMFYYGVHFFPTTYQAPYPDYPSTGILLIYLASLPFGSVNQFSAILPTAMTCALILMLTYRIGALYHREWGILGALFALFTLTFITDARTISLDQYVSLVTVACFYCAHSATLNNRKQPLIKLLCLLALGFAFRGPIGLVIPTGVLCGYYLVEKQYKSLLWISLSGALLLMVCSILLLIAAYYQGGRIFVDEVIKMQVVGRLNGDTVPLLSKMRNSYFIEALGTYAISYPVAVIVALAYAKRLIKHPGQVPLLSHLIIWTLVILIGMSLTGDHKTRYILSITPAIALLSAYLLCQQAEHPGWLLRVKQGFIGFCFILPLLGIIGILGGWYYLQRNDIGLSLPLIFPTLGLFILAFIIECIWLQRTSRKRNKHMIIFTFALGLFVSIQILIVEPVQRELHPARAFVHQVEELRTQNNADLGFYRIGADREAIKYIVHADQPLMPVFIDNPNQLLEKNKPFTYFIAVDRDINQLPAEIKQHIHIVMQGSIERLDVVVFTVS